MKNTTRKIAIFALLLAAAVTVHAYTKDDAIVNYMGSYSRYNFNKQRFVSRDNNSDDGIA